MNDYDQQAQDFLDKTDTALAITHLHDGPYFNDDDGVKRGVYAFTLTNSKGVYSGKFGGSIDDYQRKQFAIDNNGGHFGSSNIHEAQRLGFTHLNGRINVKELKKARKHQPSAYDILACLSSYYPETFKEFCDEFGYTGPDSSLADYPKVMQVFTACTEEARGMCQLFTEDEREQLAEIN